MRLDDLDIYTRSMELGETVWQIVATWNGLAQNTVGRQLIRSADSVAANISEGFGRFHYKENKQFCYYARGSLYETRTWITKAHQRGLMDQPTFQTLQTYLNDLAIKLNRYIKNIGKPTQS